MRALRTRVNMSAMGSTVIYPASLPARLGHARDLAGERKFPETDPAERKLAQKSARPSAVLAAVAQPTLKFRRFLFFSDLRGRSHNSFTYCRKGIPKWRNSASPSASVRAVVVILMFKPFTFSTLL